MDLNEYLARPDAMSLTKLSEAIDISKGRLSQLRRETEWPPDVALRAEEATGGLIDAAAMSSVIKRARMTPASCGEVAA